MIPLSAQDYEEEDAEFVELALRFENMDAQVEAELIERARKQ